MGILTPLKEEGWKKGFIIELLERLPGGYSNERKYKRGSSLLVLHLYHLFSELDLIANFNYRKKSQTMVFIVFNWRPPSQYNNSNKGKITGKVFFINGRFWKENRLSQKRAKTRLFFYQKYYQNLIIFIYKHNRFW